MDQIPMRPGVCRKPDKTCNFQRSRMQQNAAGKRNKSATKRNKPGRVKSLDDPGDGNRT
jgi:hypothetical protein